MGGQKAKDSLGQALIKQRNAHRANKDQRQRQHKGFVESHIDVRDLDTVIEQAELAGRIFSSTNPLPEFLVTAESSDDDTLSPNEKQMQRKEEEALHQSSLKIPRRPKWHSSMTSEELDIRERQSFLNWRREIARLEENEKLVVTPFEKNIDVWRQLWRVVERSDLVVTVVDARNPLFYRCPDLETYVQEIDPFKQTMLLVNKADLLPISARSKWSLYFRSQGISFLFWSAKNATAILEGKGLENPDNGAISLDEDDTRVYGREELLEKLEAEAKRVSQSRKEAAASLASKAEQLNMDDVDGASLGSTSHQHGLSKHVVVGFVGYPNVGKSSTINALVGEKKTGVTSTPGKTKHFQTLILSENLMLCDCPGLVFPSFTSSRSDMVASGVLPIDRLTDYRGPVQVIANLVPRRTLEELYGLSLPEPKPYEPQDRPPMAHELLHAFCRSRGYVAAAGLADETRAARQILKDYVNGKLVFYHLPPSDSYSDTSEGDYEESDADVESSVCGNATADKILEYEGIMNHLDSFESTAGLKAVVPKNMRKAAAAKDAAMHKKHKKAPRKKDRSWKVGNDESDGMPLVRGVAKPVSYGAARLAQSA